jgi:hypothetical protein
MFSQLVGGGGKDYFGTRLDVPKIPGLADILKTGTAANMANVPGLEKLATATNMFNQAEITRMLESTAPGLLGGIKSATTNAASLARGEIPDDVSRAVQSSSAAKSLAGGFGGSGLGRNLTARDLGLTSLNLTGEGQQRLMGLGGFARNLFPTFDYTTAFFSPAQMLDHAYSTFQRDLLAAKSAAAPDPVKRGKADQEMALFGMIMSAYGGGAGYTGAKYGSSGADVGGGGGGYSGYLGNGQWDMGGGKTQGPTYLPGYRDTGVGSGE